MSRRDIGLRPGAAIDQFALFDALRRRRRLIAGVVVTGALVVAAVVSQLPRQYEGTMKFLVRQARAEMLVTSDPSSAVYSGDVNEAEMNSEIELLNGRDLLEDVAERTVLNHLGPDASTDQYERAVRRLQDRIKIVAVRRANVILVTYAGETPEGVLSVLQQLSSLYLEKHLAAHQTPGAYGFFKAQTDRYKEALNVAQGEFSRFRQERNVVALEAEKNLLIQRRSDLQAQAAATSAAFQEVAERLALLRKSTGAMAPTVVAQTRSVPNVMLLERLTTMAVELKNKRTQLLTKFQPDDRAVRELDQQISDTEAALESVRAKPGVEQTTELSGLHQSLLSDLAKGEVELAGLMGRQRSLVAEHTAIWNRITSLEASTPEHHALEAELNATEANVRLYETKQEEARIAEALDREKITNVTVAQEPTVPRTPSGPNRAMLLVVGVLLAGIAGLASALAIELFTTAQPDQPVSGGTRSQDDVEPVSQPAWSILPSLQGRGASHGSVNGSGHGSLHYGDVSQERPL